MTLLRSLLVTDSNDIGLKFEGVGFWVESFGIGTIRDAFQVDGTVALEMDKLNKCTSTGVTLPATPFSIFAEMPSGPLDLVESRLINRTRSRINEIYTVF